MTDKLAEKMIVEGMARAFVKDAAKGALLDRRAQEAPVASRQSDPASSTW